MECLKFEILSHSSGYNLEFQPPDQYYACLSSFWYKFHVFDTAMKTGNSEIKKKAYSNFKQYLAYEWNFFYPLHLIVECRVSKLKFFQILEI